MWNSEKKRVISYFCFFSFTTYFIKLVFFFVHSSGLIYFFKYHVYFSIFFFFGWCFTFEEIILFKFSPINCFRDANELHSPCVLKEKDPLCFFSMVLHSIKITQAYFCVRQSQPCFNSPFLPGRTKNWIFPKMFYKWEERILRDKESRPANEKQGFYRGKKENAFNF